MLEKYKGNSPEAKWNREYDAPIITLIGLMVLAPSIALCVWGVTRGIDLLEGFFGTFLMVGLGVALITFFYQVGNAILDECPGFLELPSWMKFLPRLRHLTLKKKTFKVSV